MLSLLVTPKSGKTSFLQTIVYALTKRYSPDEVNNYTLSFAGRELEVLEKLPHVGKVIYGGDSERFHRLLRFLQNQIELRKTKFGETQSQDLLTYNASVQKADRLPSIFVLIDNFGELRNTDYVDELAEIEKFIQTGRIYGLFFIITALQSNDISYRITNLIQHRFVFKFADHSEYLMLIGRPDSLDFESLPKGRCFVGGTTPPLQCQIGLPPDKDSWSRIAEEETSKWGDGKLPYEIGNIKQLVYLSENLQKVTMRKGSTDLEIGTDGDTLEGFRINFFGTIPIT